jgi:hypothetical protein
MAYLTININIFFHSFEIIFQKSLEMVKKKYDVRF